jgi:uncharacterized protein (TIRG00374 family)
MKRYRRKIIIGLALGFGVVVATMLASDVNELSGQVVRFPWAVMLPVIVLRMMNWILRFFKWHFYLHVVGVTGIRRDDSAAVFLSGFVLALSPGKAGEALKALVIRSLTGTPVARTLPVVAAERFSDGLAVLFLLVFAVGSLAADQYWPLVVAALLLMALSVALLQFRALCLWLLDRFSGLPVVRRFADPMRMFYESSYEIVQWRNLAVAVGLGTVANALDGVGVYLILTGIGQSATMETFLQALLLVSLSVVIGSISTLPGGLGAADISIGMMMQAVVGFEPAPAGFATLLVRFVQLWLGVIVGMIVGVIYRERLLLPDIETEPVTENPRRALADRMVTR